MYVMISKCSKNPLETVAVTLADTFLDDFAEEGDLENEDLAARYKEEEEAEVSSSGCQIDLYETILCQF